MQGVLLLRAGLWELCCCVCHIYLKRPVFLVEAYTAGCMGGREAEKVGLGADRVDMRATGGPGWRNMEASLRY